MVNLSVLQPLTGVSWFIKQIVFLLHYHLDQIPIKQIKFFSITFSYFQGLTEDIVKHRPDDPLEFLVLNLTEKDDKDKKQNKTKETETQTKASDT